MTTAPEPEYSQGGLIERGNPDLTAWIHDCGPIIPPDKVRMFGDDILRRINESSDDHCA